MDIRSPLGQNRILQGLPAADLEALLSHSKKMDLVKGRVLYHPGDEIDYVCFPLAGMISLLAVMKSGEQVETGVVGRWGVVGATIASGGPFAFGQTVVQIEGGACRLPRGHFLSMYETSAAFRKLVNEFNGYLYFQAMQSAACHAVHPVHARFCRWLLHTQDVLESELVELTQESIADMLGVQRAAVSLCAQQLQAAGLIQYSRGSIKIVNREGLEVFACECYEATRHYTDKMSRTVADKHGRPHVREHMRPLLA